MIGLLESLQNIDLLSVGIAVAGMVLLGFAVLFINVKSITNRVFFYLSITAGIWGVINYLSYQPYSVDSAFWLLRGVLFLGVWSSFFTFTFTFVFPSETIKFPAWYKWGVFPITAITALLSLTPIIFNRVAEASADGKIFKITNGPGILIFALTNIFLNLGAIICLIRKIKKHSGDQKKSLFTILFGILLMVSSIIIFNFILPAFYDNIRFIPLGAVFLFPFIAFTSYAIGKHHLFNVKIAGAASLVFGLSILTFIEVIAARETSLMIYRTFVFILVLMFGTFLIKGILREVKQREQLGVLNKELNEANDKLEELDKARAEFISIASHQLRTPPATIKWYLSALKSGDYGKMDQEVFDTLTKAEVTNNSQIALIDDLLNASRIERGKMEFLFEPADLIAITQLTYEQLLPQATMHNLKLVWNKPSNTIPPVIMDKEKLRQVINNFIDNAIKYTKTGSVTIEMIQDETNVGVKVSDTGKGFSPEIGPVLFEKYTRGKDSVMHSQGLGLGLYVAKIIIEKHNGKIWATSPGEGLGSTFAFTIPLHNTLHADDTSTLDLTAAASAHK